MSQLNLTRLFGPLLRKILGHKGIVTPRQFSTTTAEALGTSPEANMTRNNMMKRVKPLLDNEQEGAAAVTAGTLDFVCSRVLRLEVVTLSVTLRDAEGRETTHSVTSRDELRQIVG